MKASATRSRPADKSNVNSIPKSVVYSTPVRPSINFGGSTATQRDAAPSKGTGGTMSTKKKLIIFIAVLVVIGIAVGLVMGLKKGPPPEEIDDASVEDILESKATIESEATAETDQSETNTNEGLSQLKDLATSLLGYNIHLANQNLLNLELFEGINIFENITVHENIQPQSKFNVTYFTSVSDLKQALLKSFDLDALDSLTKTYESLLGTNDRKESAVLMDKVESISSYSLLNEDDYQLSSEFLKDFENLPAQPVKDPHIMQSWLPFEQFILKYGSHVVTHVDIGLRVQYWQFSDKVSNESKKNMHIKLCESLKGSSVYKDAECSSYSETDFLSKEAYLVPQNRIIIGGTQAKKAHMHAYPHLIDKFFSGDLSDAAPIGFKFKSIFSIIDSHVKKDTGNNEANTMRRYNMNMYFQMLSRKCDFVPKYRYLEYDNEKRSYVCVTFEGGCLSDSDCHFDGELIHLGGCYLYGPTAFVWENNTPVLIPNNINQRWEHCKRGTFPSHYCVCDQKRSISFTWYTKELLINRNKDVKG